MKKVLFLLSFALFIGVVHAQTENEQVWHSDVNVAIQQSLATKKPMFLFFTGSDWCGWCIRLQKEVFQTPYFTQWAKENVILVELDYPRKKQLPDEVRQQNQTMQQIFQVQGYPTVHLVTPEPQQDGTVTFTSLGQSGYAAGGPESWCATATGMIKK
jgi:thioredoxin-related protein